MSAQATRDHTAVAGQVISLRTTPTPATWKQVGNNITGDESDGIGVSISISADGETLFRQRYEVRDRVYASLVAGDGKLYAQLRDGTCLVLAVKPEYEVLAENKLGGDDELFSGTPALAGGRIFLRSSEAVYCVGGK